MSYYEDLTLYEYENDFQFLQAVNIGWLDRTASFLKGQVDDEFLEKLFELCAKPVAKTRGFHVCPFCSNPQIGETAERKGRSIKELGSAEVWVRGLDGILYAAPTLIYHYIESHNYLPPAAFIEAVKNGQRFDPEVEVYGVRENEDK